MSRPTVRIGGAVQGGGGTPSGVYEYTAPAAPQFARWLPELYLPLDGAATDASPRARTVTVFGATPPTFVADSPFGSGQCLQSNPSGVLVSAGLQVAANQEILMSYTAESTGTPWALGCWFKASSAPAIVFSLLNTIYPWAASGKGLSVQPATGRTAFDQFGTPPSPHTVNVCDGAWHQITVQFWRNMFGRQTLGDAWIDGVRVADMATFVPNAAPAGAVVALVAGNDTTQSYRVSDLWYINAAIPDNLPSLLWNGGAGRRYDAATGLIEILTV